MKALGTLTAMLLLSGCTNTPTDLVADANSFDGEIRVDVGAQAAYRSIRDASRICLESSPMGTPVTVESEFDGDMGEGQVNQRMIAQGVRLNLAIIAIHKTSQSSADIKLYTLKGLSSVGTRRPSLESIRKWVTGDKSC